jgi:hypothetical protein
VKGTDAGMSAFKGCHTNWDNQFFKNIKIREMISVDAHLTLNNHVSL